MYDQSGSETAGAGADALPPHIRDMLAEAQAEPEIESRVPSLSVRSLPPPEIPKTQLDESDLAILKSSLSQSRARSEHLKSRCDELTKILAERDRQLRELRGYVHDASRIQERDHAYLRATHLDPAVALEIELLKRRLETAGLKPDPDPIKQLPHDLQAEFLQLTQRYNNLLLENDELSAATASAQAERDFLRLTVRELREELAAKQEWNDCLEEEREDFFTEEGLKNNVLTEQPPQDNDTNNNGYPSSNNMDISGSAYPPLPPQYHYQHNNNQEQQQVPSSSSSWGGHQLSRVPGTGYY
uniref:Uncharacterized protein n=1 Tax=Aureoumbra lagunensis TaxID=44058 RepID=A0A7S3NMK0_9STRA|mmetsp:Transcript_7811/g.11835  ORF Transcript_7811/g.11835 Transcript_7811/m.11835 type:complete len:300 (+) Transcript_7811:27-926(+)